jgi:hypothetical protein
VTDEGRLIVGVLVVALVEWYRRANRKSQVIGPDPAGASSPDTSSAAGGVPGAGFGPLWNGNGIGNAAPGAPIDTANTPPPGSAGSGGGGYGSVDMLPGTVVRDPGYAAGSSIPVPL